MLIFKGYFYPSPQEVVGTTPAKQNLKQNQVLWIDVFGSP